MAASLAASLDGALRDAHALAVPADVDPLRLELPPDHLDDATLAPRATAVLGSLYLLSELELADVVPCAELLATERWGLGVRSRATVERLEAYADHVPRWPGPTLRAQLYGRLFGAVVDVGPGPEHASPIGVAAVGPPGNDVFEELLAGYCQALVAVDARSHARSRTTLRTAGDRLRTNLAPRQYGNTLIVAPGLVEQLQASLDLLGDDEIGTLVQARGVWGVVRALHPDGAADIGRRVDRGVSGRVVVTSVGFPAAPDLVEARLVEAARTWLTATGFDLASEVG